MSTNLIGEISAATEYLTRAQYALLDIRVAENTDALVGYLNALAMYAETLRKAADRAICLTHQYQPDKTQKEEP